MSKVESWWCFRYCFRVYLHSFSQVNPLQHLKDLSSMFQVWAYEGPEPGGPTPSQPPCFLSSHYRHCNLLCVNSLKDRTSSDRCDCPCSSSQWNRWRGAPKHFWGKIIDPSLRSYLRQCPANRLRSVTGKRQRHGGRISCACYVLCIIVSLQVIRDPKKVLDEGFCSKLSEVYEVGWVILLH